MNKEKERYEMCAKLLRPLAVGKSAVFVSDGQLYQTSRVVAVEYEDAQNARFETLNSRYSLSSRPFPSAAVSLFPVRLAACA